MTSRREVRLAVSGESIMFLALRELAFAKGRFTLMGAVIALIAVLTVLLSGLATGLVDDGISGLRALPVTHLAFQQGADSTFSRSTVDSDSVAAFDGIAGVAAEPFGLTLVNATSDRGVNVDLALMGLADGGFVAAEMFPDGPPPPGAAVVSEGLVGEGVDVGDTLSIDRSTVSLTIAAVAPKATYGHVDAVYVPLPVWQEVAHLDDEDDPLVASAVAIHADDAAEALEDAAATAGLEVVTRTEAYAGSPGYSAETSTMSLIRGFLYLISAMVLGSFFTVWTIQRRSEIGLQKALGASTGKVLQEALGQVLIVLAAATFAGAAVGYVLGKLIEGGDVPFSLGLRTVLGSAGILIVSGAVGMLVGVRKVTSVDPIIALGGAA
jgi:putative ABC transport system permease protein